MSTIIEYLGYASFRLITSKNVKILIDPFIDSNPKSPVKVKDLEGVDIVLVTHGAYEHLGDTEIIAKEFGSTIICGGDVQAYLIQRGVPRDQVKAIVWGLLVEELGVKIRAVESKHWSLIRRTDGSYLSGVPLGFIVYDDPNARIYHSDDTALFSDMKLIGELYQPNVGLLNISFEQSNIVSMPKLLTGEMSPYEAALATQWLGLEYAIPMHFDDPEHPDVHRFSELLKTMTSDAESRGKPIVLKPAETLTIGEKGIEP